MNHMPKPRYEVRPEDTYGREFFFRQTSDGQLVTNDQGELIIGSPLDHESIVKRKFGKMAYGTQISIGLEQLLHPQIGAAVEHTGKFWSNPYNRVAISMDPIMAVVYADNPYVAGSYVQHLHQGISGKDHNGKKFNALNPDAFYWAHKTFERGVENYAEHYSPELFTDADREQLQHESATWYSYYGMPMNQVTTDYASHLAYREHMVNDVLEMNPSAERAIDMALSHNPPRPENVPRVMWSLAKVAMMPVTEIMSTLAIGELPQDIRDKFGIPFSKDDQKLLNNIRTVVKAFEDPLPAPLQYLTVYDAVRRDRGGEHGSIVDHMAHTGISLGSTAVATTIQRVRNFRSLLPV